MKNVKVMNVEVIVWNMVRKADNDDWFVKLMAHELLVEERSRILGLAINITRDAIQNGIGMNDDMNDVKSTYMCLESDEEVELYAKAIHKLSPTILDNVTYEVNNKTREYGVDFKFRDDVNVNVLECLALEYAIQTVAEKLIY